MMENFFGSSIIDYDENFYGARRADGVHVNGVGICGKNFVRAARRQTNFAATAD